MWVNCWTQVGTTGVSTGTILRFCVQSGRLFGVTFVRRVGTGVTFSRPGVVQGLQKGTARRREEAKTNEDICGLLIVISWLSVECIGVARDGVLYVRSRGSSEPVAFLVLLKHQLLSFPAYDCEHGCGLERRRSSGDSRWIATCRRGIVLRPK